MAYTEKDIIAIITPDNILYQFRSVLSKRFNLFEDYFIDNPNAQEVVVDLTTNGLQNLFVYVDNGKVPSTVTGWFNLLVAADYLDLISIYHDSLLRQADQGFIQLYEPTLGEDILYYSGETRFKDLRDAIDGFSFLYRNRQ